MYPWQRLRTPQFGFVLLLFLLLVGIAHLQAEKRAAKDAEVAAAIRDRQTLDWKGQEGEIPPTHTVVYYRVIFTIWVATLLVTVALCFYALRRPGGPSNYWVQFWTFSYAAYLLHFYWAAGVLFGWNFAEILGSPLGVNQDLEKVVCNPVPDLILTVWWGLDVILAWFGPPNFRGPDAKRDLPGWLLIERGALSLFTLTAFFGATVLAPKAGWVAHLLGAVLAVSVLTFYALRIALRPLEPGSLSAFIYVRGFQLVNLFLPWHRLPTFLGAMNLGAMRELLRARNLHSTSWDNNNNPVIPVTNNAGYSGPPPFDPRYLGEREADGFYDDLHQPAMGSGSEIDPSAPLPGTVIRSNPGARFGRNIPLRSVKPEHEPELLRPNPRDISNRLLARTDFKPADILNYLAAAWIQFETHDWFFHGNPVPGNEYSVDVKPQDPWGPGPMRIRRTPPDPTRQPGDRAGPPTFANAESHWWDGSQVYGDDPKTVRALRCDPQGNLQPHGRLYVDQNSLLPIDPDTRQDMSGFTGNWWIGLTLLHTLFTLEHNALCDHLHGAYPDWDDDHVYRTARLVNAALMAKIHTVEWTTAILPNAALQIAMNANWWGLFGAGVKKAFGRLSENEAFSGIPGSATNHHSAPYSLTEEFVAVYRLHPLMRDDINLCRVRDGSLAGTVDMSKLLRDGARAHINPTPPVPPGTQTRQVPLRGSMADWFYSFGICPPGAVVLRNYPNYLRDLTRSALDPDRVDLAAIDVLRDRERGVPRYNQFRESVHMPRFRSIDHLIRESRQLSADKALASEFRAVYGNDVNRVDLMTGMFAETPPEGFGFSDTAFRIFILMASRRLKSDRFFTTDFTPEVYSPAGMDWLNNNGMASILLRHYPELAPALRGVDNPFAPWKTVANSRGYQPYESRDR